MKQAILCLTIFSATLIAGCTSRDKRTKPTARVAPPEGMVRVEGGTFQMGATKEQDPNAQEDEAPVHAVTVSSFYMGVTEVTNAQYCQFLNAYGSDVVKGGPYDGKKMMIEWPTGMRKTGPTTWAPQAGYENHPAIPLTWPGADEYCKWRKCRLPTEAEWEYAARGGQKGTSTPYAGSSNIDEIAWHNGNSSVANSSRPDKTGAMAVQTKAPNQLGLHDMSGNVWEWCADWYAADFYTRSDHANNPLCDDGEKQLKVLRGGSWHNKSSACRVADRGFAKPASYTIIFGFRVAASVDGQ